MAFRPIQTENVKQRNYNYENNENLEINLRQKNYENQDPNSKIQKTKKNNQAQLIEGFSQDKETKIFPSGSAQNSDRQKDRKDQTKDAKSSNVIDQEKKKGMTKFQLNEEEEKIYLNYIPIKDELLNWEELKLQDDFAVKSYKDSIYRGQIIDSLRHGKGVITYNNQRVYEGQWHNDKRHGMGFERFTNGNIYEGQYKKGKVHGQGKYTWVNGEFYDGQWINGLKQGHGTWENNDNEQYSGQWFGNQPNGFGKHIWENGDVFEGEWKACLRHGKGCDKFSVGDSYVGEYQYGKAEGYGQYSWSNGNIYLGQFFNGMKNGQGMWKKNDSQNSNQYEGRYKNDKKHGYGEFQWSTGSKYKGNYVNDQKVGYGEMYWKDGTIYRGFWGEGQQNGIGLMIFKDGMRKAGVFQNNIYEKALTSIQEFEEFIKQQKFKIPETFRQEIKEYIGLLQPDEDNSQFLGKQFNQLEQEDFMGTNQFKYMQEMGLAPFGPAYGLTKEEYAKQVAELEEAEKKHHNEQEPIQLQETPEEFRQKQMQTPPADSQANRKKLMLPKIMIFHDFDYINPITMLPQGDTFEGFQHRLQLIQQTTSRSINNTFNRKGFGNIGGSTYSPGKSVFVASDMGSDKLKSKTRLGGYKSPLRALKNVRPFVKKEKLSPGLRQTIENRFQQLNIKQVKLSQKRNSMLPKINSNRGISVGGNPKRLNQNNKILKPLIQRKQNKPWIPSGNTGHIYTGKIALDFIKNTQYSKF